MSSPWCRTACSLRRSAPSGPRQSFGTQSLSGSTPAEAAGPWLPASSGPDPHSSQCGSTSWPPPLRHTTGKSQYSVTLSLYSNLSSYIHQCSSILVLSMDPQGTEALFQPSFTRKKNKIPLNYKSFNPWIAEKPAHPVDPHDQDRGPLFHHTLTQVNIVCLIDEPTISSHTYPSKHCLPHRGTLFLASPAATKQRTLVCRWLLGG